MNPRIAMGIVLAGAALILCVRAGSIPLLDPDESRFARTSVEMLQSGDLVVPRFGGEPRLVKPPLLHWLQAALFSVTGATPWAARAHAILATLGSILLVGWIGARRFGSEGGVWAGAILATMPLVFVPGRVGTLDALLAVHVFAVVAIDLAEPPEDGGYRPLAIGGLLGLAFLVKGPVGVILPLLLVLAGRTAARRDLLPTPVAALRGFAAWCVVVLPWGLAFVRRVGPERTLATLRGEVLERYFAGTVHTEPPWFYLQVVAVGFLPWLAPLLVGLARAWRLRREPVARTAVYAAAGLLAGLVFLSLGQSKLASYVLPLAPLAAILITWELGQEIESPLRRTLGSTLLAATVACCSVLLGLAGWLRLEDTPRSLAFFGAGLFGVGAFFAIHAALRHRPRRVYGAAAVVTGAFLFLAAAILLPEIGARKSAGPLVEAVPQLASSRPVVTVEIQVPSLTFYLGRAPEVLEMEGLVQRIAQPDRPLLVLADVDLPDVPPEAMRRLHPVGEHAKFRVFETKP